jgi:hypothetical protein
VKLIFYMLILFVSKMSTTLIEDETGIVTGDIKKISYHLYYTILNNDNKVPTSSKFIIQFYAHYLNKFHLIAEELSSNSQLYPNYQLVINTIMKDVLKVRYAPLYSNSDVQKFTIRWVANNYNTITNIYERRNHISTVFNESSLEMFKEFITIIYYSPYKCRCLHILREIFEDYLTDVLFSDKILMIEKIIAVTEVDDEDKLIECWKLIVTILEERTHNGEQSLQGYVFKNKNRLNKVKAKYFKRNAFDEILDQVSAVYDIIVETNYFHYGVDRLIVEYL